MDTLWTEMFLSEPADRTTVSGLRRTYLISLMELGSTSVRMVCPAAAFSSVLISNGGSNMTMHRCVLKSLCSSETIDFSILNPLSEARFILFFLIMRRHVSQLSVCSRFHISECKWPTRSAFIHLQQHHAARNMSTVLPETLSSDGSNTQSTSWIVWHGSGF